MLLESAVHFVEKETITDQEQYNELVREATRIIQAKIDEAVPRDMEHGKKFKAGRQAPGMMTSILDDELRKVLNIIGVGVSFEDILKYIEEGFFMSKNQIIGNEIRTKKQVARISSGGLMDTRATAEYLGVKKNTLEIWRLRGTGPDYVKLGRAVRYRLSDIEDFVEKQIRQNTSQA